MYSRIAFSGSHGVGKTSLLSELYDWFVKRHFSVHVIPESARLLTELSNNPDYFLKDYTLNKQLEVLLFQVAAEGLAAHKVSNTILLSDRTGLDVWAYSKIKFPDTCNSSIGVALERLIAELTLSTFERIYFVPIEFQLPKTRDRIQDVSFQKEIEKKIIELYVRYSVEFKSISGDLSLRAEKVINDLGFA